EFAEAVRGRAVLIGVTARGLGPELAIAALGKHTTVPAVRLHALAYDAFVAGALITPLPVPVSALMTLTLLLAAMALWPAGEKRWQQALLAGSVLLPLVLSWLLLRTVQIWWGPAPAMLGLLVAWGAWLAVHMNAAARAAHLARRDAKAMLDSIGDAVISLDADSRITYLNGPAQSLASDFAPLGRTVADAFAFDTESGMKLSAMIRRALSTGEVARVSDHLVLKLQSGRDRALSATISPLLTEAGPAEGVVIALGDLTEAVASAQQLSHAATHDALTGLPNRSLVHDRLTHAATRAVRVSSTVAVLFLDLDRFKRINDSLGHQLGDEVLKVTGQRLLATCRATDTVGRWGGDEFVVLLEDLAGREAVATVAKKIVEALSQPMLLDGIEVQCACSVGIAVAPDDGIEAVDLLAMADAAMYRAKSQSGTHYEFYMSDLNRWTRDRLTMELDMRNGLTRGEFELHYQPQIHLESGSLVGFEALLRWRRENGDLLMPAQFIGLAEETGLIIELGEWVMREATRQIAEWNALGLQVVPVAINVSARQCLDRQIVDALRVAVETSGIDAALLKVEITESTAMANAENAVSLFDEIRALGIRLSVDDFGTGYSSLSRLKRFPVGELKIDRSFVRDMTSDPDDAAIVRATIALAHGLGLRVVAEGVETPEQKLFLAYHGCDMAQGYLWGRAQPAELVQPLLDALTTSAARNG
ncbi:MAG: EAL domain-containing protein, partial [Burkholderiales bacterium]